MKQLTLIDNSRQFTWHDSGEFGVLRDFTGFEYSSTRQAIENLPSRDGALYINSKFGQRRLSWQGDFVGSERFAKRREMLDVMGQGNLKTLKFTTFDDLQLQAEVEILNVVNPYIGMLTTFLIEAVAPDWRFFSQTLYEPVTGITTSTGGTPVPSAIPSPIGGASGTLLQINNLGNERTSPTFTIYGPGTNFVIQNVTTGQQFNLNLTLTSVESAVVNTVQKTARKGNQNIYNTFAGDFWDIYPGINRISFGAASGTSANTRLKVSYRDAYRGV